MRIIVFLILVPQVIASAAVPVIQNVTDAAAYGPRVAPGSLAVLFGAGLASSTASANTLPLTTNLAGTTLTVAGKTAPLLYVSPAQITFQVPAATPAGTAKVIVNGPGGASAAYSLTITAQAPAIFQYGTNHAMAQNADGSLNSTSARAASGSYITVYLTGQGAVNNPVADGQATPASPLATATATATATIGTTSASVAFLGLTPGLAGLAQANIQVPDLPTGDYPLFITAGGYLSASAVISVSGTGTAYTSPLTQTGFAAFANSTDSTVALYGNIAYICGASRIVMVDITYADNPTYVGEFGDSTLNGYGDSCSINTQGSYPYLVELVNSSTGAESLAVFRLTNPTAPALLSVTQTKYDYMQNLSFVGNYGFINTSYITWYTATDALASQTGQFLVFDFTNPVYPGFVSSLPPSSYSSGGNQMPFAALLGQSYAMIASTTASGTSTAGTGVLDVLSIASPGAPYILNQIQVPQAAILTGFAVSGTTLLAAGNTAGQRNPGTPDFDYLGNLTLTAMDVSNPPNPVIQSTVNTGYQVNGAFDLAAFSNGIFAMVSKSPVTDDFGPSSMLIVDARNPANLQIYPFETQFGLSGITVTTGGYLIAASSTGLTVFKLGL